MHTISYIPALALLVNNSMRFTPAILIPYLLFSLGVWQTDFEAAKKQAGKEHKLILLSFSGSDWCGPCIKLHKDIFETAIFNDFAGSNLVLVNADFPRLKKNQLPKDQQEKNDKLADKYDPDGIFPLTLLLDADGNLIKKWEGLPHATAEQFTGQLKDQLHERQ